ncbi:hypothetical protein UACE39S_06140 [Ureibacillus acetophenoni]
MKIVVFGDLHYPTIKETYAEMKHEGEIFFKEFLNQVFKVEADLYVSLGDLTNYGLQDQIRRDLSYHQRT